jgi:hypothetical protein
VTCTVSDVGHIQLKGNSMKKGWVVAYRSISDKSAVKAYGALALPAVESFGGHFLTRLSLTKRDGPAATMAPCVTTGDDSNLRIYIRRAKRTVDRSGGRDPRQTGEFSR